jgi:hypothetical protein
MDDERPFLDEISQMLVKRRKEQVRKLHRAQFLRDRNKLPEDDDSEFDVEHYNDEDDIQNRKQKAKTREIFEMKHWPHPEATPNGRYSRDTVLEDGTVVLPEPSPAVAALLASSVKLSHYDVDTNASLLKSQYFPGGKKVFPDRLPMSQF